MAVSKLWAVNSRLGQVIDYAANPEKTAVDIYSEEQYQALADVLSYAKDEEKTEREYFVEGINCNPTTARDQFVSVKQAYGKEDGIQAYHGYLSFKEQNITPELAQKIGMEFANEVWGKRFQVVVTTHLNTKHLHCHYVINSVSFKDGKRCQDTSWFKFRKVADRICEKYGLYYNPNPNRSKQSSYYYKQEQAGMPTRYSMVREAIDEAIAHSTNIRSLDYALTQMGYEHCLSESRKYWTIVPKGYTKPIRLKNLGEDYTEEAIRRRLMENQRVRIVPFAKQTVVIRQYRLPTRENKIKKVGGLYGLYLHYCYRLGYLPKYKKQNTARLHYLLKEDLLKLDKITAETRLLGRENISTDEQLFSYKESLKGQIKTLTDDRTHLRKIARTKMSDDELSKVKKQISTVSDKIRELNKEVRLCDDIAERSKVMEQNLETIRAEEENNRERSKSEMTNSGDAAEQVVRLSLEGFEVAARLTGSAAKNIAILLASVLKQEATQANKTRGKARLTNMIKSGKELKVFSIPNKDLKKFTEQAKRYGVLYCVLRDKNTRGDNVPIDIIARAEDASKIQRIVERFELGKVDKAAIVTESQKAVEKREAVEKDKPTKSKNEIITEEAVRKPLQKEENAQSNPTTAKTDKNPPSRQNSEPEDMQTDKGIAVDRQKKPSVKEKLDRYKAQAKQQKEAERKEPETDKAKRPSAPKQTVHQQPKTKSKKPKER